MLPSLRETVTRRAARGAGVVLVAALLAACNGDRAGPIGVEETETPLQETSSPADEPSPTTTAADGSEPVVPEHGGTYWGVYLASGEGPDLEDAIQYLTEERGLEVERFNPGSDIHCDKGARRAIGRRGPLVVAVYFETEEQAEAWAETLPAPPLGIGEVRTFCLD